jgi:hypothetical protein
MSGFQQIDVPVQFTGTVTIQVPDRLLPTDAKLLAAKLALARIIATCDRTADTPEDDAFSDYVMECSEQAQRTAVQDWDMCKDRGVCGKWTTNPNYNKDYLL